MHARPCPNVGPLSLGRNRLVACNGKKNSQKNNGLYFEYESVDPEAAKEIPIEKGEQLAPACAACVTGLLRVAERKKEEFDWVQRARRASGQHRGRREQDLNALGGRRRAPAPGGSQQQPLAPAAAKAQPAKRPPGELKPSVPAVKDLEEPTTAGGERLIDCPH